MSWAEPAYLWLLLGVPVLALVLAVTGALHRRKLRKALSRGMADKVLPRRVRVRRTLRDLAVLLAFAAATVALAEPRFDKQVRTLQTRGTDLVLLLDLSRSMDAKDVDPSRLERARREIADLGRLMEGDRVGLVVFAGGAYPRLPLTADFRAVQLVVSEVRTDTFDTQGSNLGAAIRTGAELLERSQEHAGQALVVLSDGETHDAEDALAAAKSAAEAHIPIFAMGIGDAPAPIPLPDGRLLQWKGATVSTTPDFEVLKQVARLTGGAFVTSNAGSADMQQLYTEVRRSVKAVERTSQQRETYRSGFQVPLALALALLLGAAWLGEGRPARGAPRGVARKALPLALVFLALAGTARAADPLTQADQLYRDQKYPQAVELLVELSLQYPDDADIQDRLGSARYRAGDYEGAARAFDRAAELGEGAGALYNAGNAEYLAGRLEDARSRYEAVLAEEPEHAGATKNRDLVTKEIEVRRAPPPPPPPKPGGEDEQKDGGGEQDAQNQPKPGKSGKAEQKGSKSEQGSEDLQQPESDGQAKDGQQGSQTSKQGPDKPGSSQSVKPGEVSDPDGDPGETGPATAEGGQPGPITAGQAHRLLDSVDEGSQRVVFQGRPEQEPW